MKVRIQLRRGAGRWVARFRTARTFEGVLMTRRKDAEGRNVTYLCVLGPEDGPELFEPRVTDVSNDEIRFLGYEQTKDLAWHLQEWDCFVLP